MIPSLPEPLLRPAIALFGILLGILFGGALPRALARIGLKRTNFQGRSIYSGAGLLFVVSTLPWWLSPDRDSRLCAAAMTGFGVLGLIDDRWGTAEFKGLRGHLRALRAGRVTTGLLKAAGGAVLAVVLALLLPPTQSPVVAAPLIALCANFLNLLDLRPLRALKAFWLLGLVPAVLGPLPLAQAWGLTLPYARLEARGSVMLGDTGSNALGGALGVALALLLPSWLQTGWVAALVLFHAWAERYSLSRWIEAHPRARALDQWGRSPDGKHARSRNGESAKSKPTEVVETETE